ncbi:MAG: hypothetical protein AAB688_01740 [Patescibacteria group bacterium]
MLKIVDDSNRQKELSLQLATHIEKAVREFCFTNILSLEEIQAIFGETLNQLAQDSDFSARGEPLSKQIKDDSESVLSGSPKIVL